MSPARSDAPRHGNGAPRAVAVLVLLGLVTACAVADGPTVVLSESNATVPESVPSVPSLPPDVALTTTTTTHPVQPPTTIADADPVFPPSADVDWLSDDAGIERTSLTAEAALGAESSLFSLVTTPDGNTLIVGAARHDDLPVATLWAVDSETGAVEQTLVLPSPPGVAATARDAVVLDDGSMIVVGAIFHFRGTVPVSWRISAGSSEPLQILPCDCVSAEAERVVVDTDGRVWVVGRDPGWRGAIVVWASSDDGRSWATPHTELTGPEQAVLVAPLDRGVAVVHWTAAFDDETDSATGWTSSVFVADGDAVRRTSAVELSLPADERNALDLAQIHGRLWLATSGPDHVSLWSSSDGDTWDVTPVPIDDFAADPYVVPIGVEPLGGGVGLVMHHGDAVDNQLTVVVFDGAGFETWPTTIEGPTYWGRYVDAWPVAGYGDGVLVLDPGWISTPSVVRIARDHSATVAIPHIPPMRRVERERVWALSAGSEAVVATIYRQYTTGPEHWVNETPRLLIGSGGSWTPIEMPRSLERVVGVVAEGDGFVVASSVSAGTVFTPVTSDGRTDDLAASVELFDAISVIGTEGGRMIAHTSDRTAPIWVKAPGGVWEPLPPVPATSGEIRRVCADDDIVVAVAVSEPDQVTVYAYSAASWASIGMMPPAAAGDNEDPRCDVTADSVMIAFRSLMITPDQFSSEWWRWDRSGAAPGTFGYFDPQWPQDRITDFSQASPGHLGMAVGLRGDDEYSYDAIAWLLDGSTPMSLLMLAGGPGIQEARATVRFGDQLLVGGTDAGAAIIWSITADQ